MSKNVPEVPVGTQKEPTPRSQAADTWRKAAAMVAVSVLSSLLLSRCDSADEQNRAKLQSQLEEQSRRDTMERAARDAVEELRRNHRL